MDDLVQAASCGVSADDTSPTIGQGVAVVTQILRLARCSRGEHRALLRPAAGVRGDPDTERLDGVAAEALSELLNARLAQQRQLVVQLVPGRCVSGLASPDLGVNFPDIEVRSVRGEST